VSTPALAAVALGKRYGRRVALRDCTVSIPAGAVAGIVGPNGAGKTTLLNLAAGLLAPTTGSIEVLGEPFESRPEHLRRVGFVAQQTPLYPNLTVAEHLRLGQELNPGWNRDLAVDRVGELGLDPGQRAGQLSGGQRAQLALTLAICKRPELLLLDEPVAALDPLARREFLRDLMAITAERAVSVIVSSHLIADLERICDHLVVLSSARVALAGSVEELLGSHRRLIGPRRDPPTLPGAPQVIEESHTDRQSTLLVRTEQTISDPDWLVEQVGLEDLVLAYMGGIREVDDDGERRRLAAVAQ
jgi:ABC-2 type transport system ATP-binding protein